MDLDALGIGLLTAFVIMKLVEAVVYPIWERFKWDRFFLFYVGIVLGAAAGWATEINIFPWFTTTLVGRILSCLAVGLGPSFLYDLLDKRPELPKT